MVKRELAAGMIEKRRLIAYLKALGKFHSDIATKFLNIAPPWQRMTLVLQSSISCSADRDTKLYTSLLTE